MKQIILIILSISFVFLSFYPSLYEIMQAKNLPKDRSFELVHNYVFDYNFYISRIREGIPAFVPIISGLQRGEGRWMVTEKYYNQSHSPSLFQIVYLYMGKLGGVFGLNPPEIYHGARIILGLILLLVIGKLVASLFSGWWQVIAYLFIVTAGSWPILIRAGEGWRFATYWGGWSVVDSLQRITFLPHVLIGQIFLVLFIMAFSDKSLRLLKSLRWGVIGLIAGIIFPPMLVVIYTVFSVITIIEVVSDKSLKLLKSLIMPRIFFVIFSLPALLYLQLMMKIQPWQALALFDIQHRSFLPYWEYAKALGPMLPLGLTGLVLALSKREKKLFPFVSWILALGILFTVFENVPQQSPTRFTQMLINVPLGILATYLFLNLWYAFPKLKRPHEIMKRGVIGIVITAIIVMGLGVMYSMEGWLTDQVKGKMASTFRYPVGAQLVYPVKDFMDGISFLKNNTKITDVVLAYEAAGNYIPAYAGNFVYLGHANTPDEDGKLKVAQKFFSANMTSDEAKKFLTRENIKYIYFGPQEREVVGIKDLQFAYSSLISSVYTNNQVVIYKILNF